MVRSRLSTAKAWLGHAKDTVVGHTGTIRSLELEYRANDAENQCRRNNIRIIGLAEGAEGNEPSPPHSLCGDA